MKLDIILLLMGPIILAGILHMLVIKFNILNSFTIPINKKLFGENKTLRGFVVMPVLGVLSIALFSIIPTFQETIPENVNLYWLGAILGLAYVLGELPNSFVKRRLGIRPGEQSNKYQTLFFIGDRIDSASGCALVYFLMGFSFEVFWIIPLAIIVHPIITIPLYLLGIKKKIF